MQPATQNGARLSFDNEVPKPRKASCKLTLKPATRSNATCNPKRTRNFEPQTSNFEPPSTKLFKTLSPPSHLFADFYFIFVV
jgi:hypothetical protein